MPSARPDRSGLNPSSRVKYSTRNGIAIVPRRLISVASESSQRSRGSPRRLRHKFIRGTIHCLVYRDSPCSGGGLVNACFLCWEKYSNADSRQREPLRQQRDLELLRIVRIFFR